MAQPPDRRARRPDSKQMWEESDRKAALPSRERDEPRRDDYRRTGRDNRGREDQDRDRNRRYRSRSPREREDRGERGERDYRNRDAPRNGERSSRGGGRGRDERDQRGGRDRERDDRGHGDRRDHNERDRGMFSNNDVLVLRGRSNIGEAAPNNRDRRERSRSRDRPREATRGDGRSKSPRQPSRRDADVEKPKGRFVEEEATRSRTSTPPVMGKANAPASETRQDEDMELEHSSEQPKKAANIKVKKEKAPRKADESDDDLIVEDDSMADMAAMMGFGGFGTTQMKQVAGNNIGAVRKEKKTEYRQYMNRQGGFNRPLSPPRGD